MKTVRIYKPAKTTMQSGRGRLKDWVLEYELETPRIPESLMGWIASGDTNNQVKLFFETHEAAIAFATTKGWRYTVHAEQSRQVRPRNYVDNFRYVPPSDDVRT